MTERNFIRALHAVLAICIVLLSASTALAACPEVADDGTGWIASPTSKQGSGDGIGGSGLKANAQSAGESLALDGGDEDGIGGSGRSSRGDEDGIGGSGLIGTITGFGSICINGRRITYDADVPVTYDGDVASSDDLEVGQVVRIVADSEEARSIDILFAVVGIVEAADDTTLSVLGQRVRAAVGAVVDESVLVSGSRVAISGLRHPDGSIVASRVDRATARQTERVHNWRIDDLFGPEITDIDVEGYVYSADSTQLNLGSVRFGASGLARDGTMVPPEFGERVHVRGPRDEFDGFNARRIERMPESRPPRDGHDLRDQRRVRPDQGPPSAPRMGPTGTGNPGPERSASDNRPNEERAVPGVNRDRNNPNTSIPERPEIPDRPPQIERPPPYHPRERGDFGRPHRRPPRP